MNFLSKDEIFKLIDSLQGEEVTFDRVRPHNKGEIRRTETMKKDDLKSSISEAIDEGHQYGGDIEVYIPSIDKTLVGHHDGIYWLE